MGYAPGWQVRCVKCGHVRDAGEAGHTRHCGWSWKRYVVHRCPKCGKLRFHAFERKPSVTAGA